MRLYEIFKAGKKQDLNPHVTPYDLIIIGKLYIFLIDFLKNIFFYHLRWHFSK
jgi:hypothetical protein